MASLFVVVGSGPGLGVATASEFASQGFNIALLSRNPERLLEDKAKVESAAKGNIQVQTFAVDAADHVGLKKTLDEVQQALGSPEVVLYNVARIAPTIIGDADAEYLIEDFKLTSVGLYVTATWALPLMTEVAKQAGTHPSFLLSSTGIDQLPGSVMFSLFMQKAAQKNLMGALAQIAGPAGVHVARSDISGIVADEEPILNAKNIAQGLYRLSRQEKSQWEHKVAVGDVDEFIEKFANLMSGGQS